MRIDVRWPALAVLLSCVAGCASAPHLKGSILDHLGKTVVVYVVPKDDIVVTDPAATELAHAGKFLALTTVTGGYFGVADIGAAAYFAGNKFPGRMEKPGQAGPRRVRGPALGRAHARRRPGGGGRFETEGRHLGRL